MAAASIKAIIGLGNPGTKYTRTRHNAGFWFIEALASQMGAHLLSDNKLHGIYAKASTPHQSVHLLMPTTFMNVSGRAAQALQHFYKLHVSEILVVHDELDLLPGVVKLKQGGGHAGHNGLRDIMACLNSPDFMRLRLGIGRPPGEEVSNYVLAAPTEAERISIDRAIDDALRVVPLLLEGKTADAMKQLHTQV